MSLGITWYTLEEAAAKYCLETSLIQKWIDEGVVRAEQAAQGVVRVNIDDIELNVQEMTRI
jgi:predicted site-specific integrase-resolvase